MSGENKALPAIPAKRYFTIGEVSELCGVKSYVLRYWEQEFTQLRPMKRRGNRRYYQHHEVLLIRRIRELLYEQGFTISGARNQLVESGYAHAHVPSAEDEIESGDVGEASRPEIGGGEDLNGAAATTVAPRGARGQSQSQSQSHGTSPSKAKTGAVPSRGVEAMLEVGGGAASRGQPGVLDPVDVRKELIAIRALLVG
jgi:DNA-binding transcriptional MerR regulator